MGKKSRRELRIRIMATLLAISYGLGAPLAAFLEYRDQVLSQRFDLPPALIYLTCAVQFACAFGVFAKPLASWAALLLTFTTLGAIASHVKIGSPETAVTAVVYTVIQVWFGLERRREMMWRSA
jgi:hypothetical protein